jgi:hypothetical protein
MVIFSSQPSQWASSAATELETGRVSQEPLGRCGTTADTDDLTVAAAIVFAARHGPTHHLLNSWNHLAGADLPNTRLTTSAKRLAPLLILISCEKCVALSHRMARGPEQIVIRLLHLFLARWGFATRGSANFLRRSDCGPQLGTDRTGQPGDPLHQQPQAVAQQNTVPRRRLLGWRCAKARWTASIIASSARIASTCGIHASSDLRPLPRSAHHRISSSNLHTGV